MRQREGVHCRQRGTKMAQLPKRARVVIIGQGGIVGSSVAHHLIEQGWDDIVGLEKSAIPSDIGSTSHASDFCFTTSHDKLNIYTTKYSQALRKTRQLREMRRHGSGPV